MVARDHKLTERERDVMLLAYEGLTNPDIAILQRNFLYPDIQ